MSRRRNLAMLLALAAIWGASFMFIKVAVRELTPATLIMGRLGLAALTLALAAAVRRRHARDSAAAPRNAGWLVVVALVNTAIPFWLLSWGETRIDSGLASILQAAVPIFNAVIAFVAFREVRVTGTRLLGVAVGFVGVALLVGAQPEGKVLGALAVVGMAFCYGARRAPDRPLPEACAADRRRVRVVRDRDAGRGCRSASPRRRHTRPAGRRSPRWSRSASPGRRSRTCSSSA